MTTETKPTAPAPSAPAIQRQRFHVHVDSQPVWAREWLPGNTLGPLATSIPRGHYVAEVREVGPARVEWVCLLGGDFQGRTVGNFYQAWVKGGARLEQVRMPGVMASEAEGESGPVESIATTLPAAGRPNVLTAWGEFPIEGEARVAAGSPGPTAIPPALLASGPTLADAARFLSELSSYRATELARVVDEADRERAGLRQEVERLRGIRVSLSPPVITPVPLTSGQTAAIEDLLERYEAVERERDQARAELQSFQLTAASLMTELRAAVQSRDAYLGLLVFQVPDPHSALGHHWKAHDPRYGWFSIHDTRDAAVRKLGMRLWMTGAEMPVHLDPSPSLVAPPGGQSAGPPDPDAVVRGIEERTGERVGGSTAP